MKKKLNTEYQNERSIQSPNQDGGYLDIEIRQTTCEGGQNQVFHTEQIMQGSPAGASKDGVGSALSARQLYDNKPSFLPLAKHTSAQQHRESYGKLNESLSSSKGPAPFSCPFQKQISTDKRLGKTPGGTKLVKQVSSRLNKPPSTLANCKDMHSPLTPINKGLAIRRSELGTAAIAK